MFKFISQSILLAPRFESGNVSQSFMYSTLVDICNILRFDSPPEIATIPLKYFFLDCTSEKAMKQPLDF